MVLIKRKNLAEPAVFEGKVAPGKVQFPVKNFLAKSGEKVFQKIVILGVSLPSEVRAEEEKGQGLFLASIKVFEALLAVGGVEGGKKAVNNREMENGSGRGVVDGKLKSEAEVVANG